MWPGSAPNGNQPIPGGYDINTNTINYSNGTATVKFPGNVPAGNPINVQCDYYQQGIPRAVLFYNNIIQFVTLPINSTRSAWKLTYRRLPF